MTYDTFARENAEWLRTEPVPAAARECVAAAAAAVAVVSAPPPACTTPPLPLAVHAAHARRRPRAGSNRLAARGETNDPATKKRGGATP